MAAAVGQKVWAQAPGSEQWVGATVFSVQENGQLELKLEPTGQQLLLTVSDEAPLCLQNEEEVEVSGGDSARRGGATEGCSVERVSLACRWQPVGRGCSS
jgi:hypothetical protein